MSDLEIRPIAPDELELWSHTVEASFGGALRPEFLELERMVARPERYLAAFDGERIVGGNASVPVDLTVPGGRRVTTCGVNAVGVAPGATRRGISTALMRRQLEDARERGEPIAILHASEAAIYGRYDFGLATRNASLTVEAAGAAFARGFEQRGHVRLVDRAEGIAAYSASRAAAPDRPGWAGPPERFAEWFVRDMELDDDFDTEKEPPFYAVHESHSGHVDGAAIYRIKHDWPEERPRNTAVVYDIAAATPRAHAEIWRFLLDLDLVATVKVWNVPIDEPLFRLVREPRALHMRVRDGLFLAFVDVPRALEARSYAGSGAIRIGVTGAFCGWNEGTWELIVEDGSAACSRTDAEPELRMSATDLASTYLGDVTFAQLAAALRVHGSAGAIARADALTASTQVPWCWLLV